MIYIFTLSAREHYPLWSTRQLVWNTSNMTANNY